MATGGAIGARAAHAVHVLGGATMGTRWRVSLSAPAAVDLHPLHAGVQACLDRVVAQMSTWEPGSDISRYNRATAGTWQDLPQPFFDVLQQALAIAARTGGAVDPTVGPLVEAWGFGPHGPHGGVPSPDVIDRARACVGWTRVELDPAGRRVLQPGGVALDLSGIAKGHAVDAVLDWLLSRGIAAALVEVGGELRAHGRKPDGGAWKVLASAADGEEATDEAHPGRSGPGPCILALADVAVATSGDHWHGFDHAGRRYSHTLDPRTGAPVRDAAAAVTVIAPTALEADAWATALTVLGEDAGIGPAGEHGVAARWLIRDGAGLRERTTPGFERYLAS